MTDPNVMHPNSLATSSILVVQAVGEAAEPDEAELATPDPSPQEVMATIASNTIHE